MLFLPMNSNDTLAIDACKPEVLKKMLLPKFWAACAWDMFQTGRFVKTHVFHTYTALSEFYLRLHPVNFTWGCIQWPLLETASFLTFTCGCILFLGTAPSELYLGLFPFWALLETASSELYLSLLETASSELYLSLLETASSEPYFRLHPVNLTWDCIHWTLPGSASSELYFRLHPVNFTWGCIQWTSLGTASSELYLNLLETASSELYLSLLETASSKLYFRLHPVNLTWDCIHWTLPTSASSELYLGLFPFRAVLETASSELYLSLLETASSELCFRLHPVNLTWDYIHWTLPGSSPSELYLGLFPFRAVLETASSELYLSLLETASSELCFRLHPVNLTWDCIHWTLPGSSSSELYLSIPEAASSELYFRLHPVNFTWGCIQWTLLETASSELYLRLLVPFWALPETASSELYLTLHPVNLASGCIQWTLPETASSELYSGLHPVNLTWNLLHTFFKIFFDKYFLFLTEFKKKVDALLTHFWCTFKKCIKSASKGSKSASKVHQI